MPNFFGCSGDDCKTKKRGVEYRGTENRTMEGKTCQRWDAQVGVKDEIT